MITRDQITAWVQDYAVDDEPTLVADGFEDAFIGVGSQFNVESIAIYDTQKCIDILMTRDGMSRDEALEYFEFNVLGAYVGPKTPIFVNRYPGE
jgi:hypothetical protein